MILAKVETSLSYTCGDGALTFSGTFPYIVSTIVLILKIAIPILLIVFGMLDLGKAVIASKEDDIKKGQQTFIKRLIAAVIVFFIFQIVQIIIGFVAGNDKSSVLNCLNCFINGTIDEEKSCAEVVEF